MNMITRKLMAAALSLLFSYAVFAQDEESKPPVNFKFGGFIKADYIETQFNNGPYSGAGRDFHIPSTIPVGNIDVYKYSDFHVKETRFNFDVSTVAGGKDLKAFLEFDFMLSPAGDERISNSYNPRIRHGYLQYGNLLAGQTWSTFMVVIIPDELDFLGAPEGLVFVRQPMIRYKLGSWQFALENQLATITPNDVTQPRILGDQGFIPDGVVRYNLKLDNGSISFAGIVRYLHYLDGNKSDRSTWGTGATVGGKIEIGSRDDIRFQGTIGTGLGRYLAVNFVNSGVIDNNGDIQTINTMNGYVAYLHHWTSKLRSSFSGSYFYGANDPELLTGTNSKAASISGNLLYSPVKKLLFGGELIYGYRELVGGTSGDFYRLQLSARYAFSFKTSSN